MSDLLAPDPASDLLGDDRLGARYAPSREMLARAHRRAHIAQAMLGVHGAALVGTLAWYATAPLADDTAVIFVSAVVYLLTVVAFAMWKVDAYRLAPALGGEPTDRTPGWAAGGYFIPIANLWIPFQVMREIWRSSDPEAAGLDVWAARSETLLVVWWALWIVSGVTARIADRLPAPAGESLGYEVFGLAVWALGLLVTGAAFLVVRRLDADQQRLGGYLLEVEATAVPEGRGRTVESVM